MTNVYFCQPSKDNQLECVANNIEWILLVFFAAFFFPQISKNINEEGVNEEKAFYCTFRFSIKQFLIGLSPILTLTILVLSFIDEQEVIISYILVYAIYFIISIALNLVIHVQNRQIGGTSTYMRGILAALFVSHIFFLFMFYVHDDHMPTWQQSREVLELMLGLVMGMSTLVTLYFVDDYPKEKRDMDISLKENQWDYVGESGGGGKSSYLEKSGYSNQENPDIWQSVHSRDDKLRSKKKKKKSQKFNANKQSSNFKSSISNDYSSDEIEQQNQVYEISVDDFDIVESAFEDTQCIFNISYRQNGQTRNTCRNLEEFFNLFIALDKTYPDLDLPTICVNGSIEREDMESYRNRFDSFLKHLTENQIFPISLQNFLKPVEDLPHFGIQRINIRQNQPQQPKAEVLNEDGNPQPSAQEKDNFQKNDNADRQIIRLDMSLANSIIEDYNQPEEKVERTLSQMTIPNLGGSQDQYYRVDIPKIVMSKDEKGLYSQYQVFVREEQDNWNSQVYKRFTEFNELHQQLKRKSKQSMLSQLPELPNRGNVGLFDTNQEDKIREYRQGALQVYLQTILNIEYFGNSSLVQNFIRQKPVDA